MEDAAIIKKKLEARSWKLEAWAESTCPTYAVDKLVNCVGWILVGVFIPTIISLAFAAEDKSSIKEEASQEIKDFNLVQYTADGKKKWELNGEKAYLYGGLIEIGGPEAVLYGEKSRFNLTAEKGFFNRPQNDVRLKDNVVVTSSDGMKLKTGYLYWQGETQNITTDAPVFMTKDNLEATGQGASCNLEAKQVRFNEDVSTSVEEGSTIITCEGPLELDYGKSRATFHKDVEVKDSQGNLLADRMDVFFDPKTKKIKRVIASGNVRIIHGENITYSRIAIYLVDKKKVILPKRPKLVIAPQKEEKDAAEQPLTPNP